MPMEVSKIKTIFCGDGFTIFLKTNGLVYSVNKIIFISEKINIYNKKEIINTSALNIYIIVL